MRLNSKLLLLFAVALAGALRAQTGAVIRTNTPEVGAFFGGSYGIDKTRVMGGGNFVYSINPRWLMPFAEFSYFPGIGRSTPYQGTKATYNIPITDFNFGVHIRFPVPGRVIPYAVVSFGGIHNGTTNATFTGTVLGQPFSFQQSVPSSTNFAASLGGGLRVYATEHVGFRGEFKAYIPSGSNTFPNGTDKFYRATGGIFYQF